MDDAFTRTQFTVTMRGTPEELDLLDRVLDGLWDDKPFIKLRSRPPGNLYRRDPQTLIWKGHLAIGMEEPGTVRGLEWIRELAVDPDFQEVEFHATMEIVINPTGEFKATPSWHAPGNDFLLSLQE